MYLVGKVLKPRGLRGEVKAEIVTSFPEHFKKLKTLLVKTDKASQTYTLSQAKLSNGYVYLTFKNIHSVEEASLLRNAELYIEQEQLTELSETEYYIHDLVGIEVFDENEHRIGELIDVESYPSSDVYIVKAPDGKCHMIPAIKDVIKQVDIKSSRMTIHVMEGLLE